MVLENNNECNKNFLPWAGMFIRLAFLRPYLIVLLANIIIPVLQRKQFFRKSLKQKR